MDTVKQERRQPWKAHQAKFGASGLVAEAGQVSYENVRGKKLVIPGSAGELNLSIEYDTGDRRSGASLSSSNSSKAM